MHLTACNTADAARGSVSHVMLMFLKVAEHKVGGGARSNVNHGLKLTRSLLEAYFQRCVEYIGASRHIHVALSHSVSSLPYLFWDYSRIINKSQSPRLWQLKQATWSRRGNEADGKEKARCR